MMVYVDDKLLFQINEAGARDVRAFDDEDGIIGSINGRCDANVARAGQFLVRVGHGIAHDDFYFFIKGAQEPVKAEAGAETITVRANV